MKILLIIFLISLIILTHIYYSVKTFAVKFLDIALDRLS